MKLSKTTNSFLNDITNLDIEIFQKKGNHDKVIRNAKTYKMGRIERFE